MIELSVMLPMYRCKYIGWLSLTSLCRQKDIDFEWELIVAEEQDDLYHGLEGWEECLESAGCTRILYMPLDKHISLGEKYYKLIRATSSTSKSIVLQDADVYAYPTRLKQTYEVFKDPGSPEWFKNDKCIFYDIYTEHVAPYTYTNKSPQGCWISMSRDRAYSHIVNQVKVRGLNKWLYRVLSPKEVVTSEEGWKYGLHTHGFNNISIKRRSRILSRNSSFNLEDIIPPDVSKRLKELKSSNALQEWKLL
jgi:hypothetical protein